MADAKESRWKASFCYYKRWGVKKKHRNKSVILLRFSKNGNPEIERAYATYYVDLARIGQLKRAIRRDRKYGCGYSGKTGDNKREQREKMTEREYEVMKQVMDR